MSNLLALGPLQTDSLPDLADQLYAHLSETSQDVHPDQVKPDLLSWQQLRLAAFGAGGKQVTALSGPDAIASLSLYYAQLTHVVTRIPPQAKITFPWYPAVPPAIPMGLVAATPFIRSSPPSCSFAQERLHTLYTIAYVHAFVGATTRRADEAGIRAALSAFQSAAGVLQLLAEEMDRRATAGDAASQDETRGSGLTSEVVQTLRLLCLAQAQEVAWQKAVMDRLKNGTVAKVAMYAAQLYQQAGAEAETVRSGGNVDLFAFADNLTRYLAFKHAHFTAVAQYRRSLDDLGANRYGDELSRLRFCEEALAEVSSKTGRRGVPEAVVRDLKSLHSMISENLVRAIKDNDLIYLASPTPPSLLPPIVPFPLAKSTPPPDLAEPLRHLNRAPWLHAMLPSRVRHALELWDDRKKTWFQEAAQKVARALDDNVASSLAALNLPAALEFAQQQPAGVPAHLLEHSQRIRSQGGLAKLETMMKDVRRISNVNRKLVQESRDLLDREAETDSSFRQTYSPSRWSRPASAEAAAPLLQRIEQLEAVLAAAGQSDELVRAKYGEWESALAVLDEGQTALRDAIPSDASSGPISRSPDSQKTARQLRVALENLSTLQADRERVVQAARTQVEQASIRKRLEQELVPSVAADTSDADGAAGAARVEQILGEELARISSPWEVQIRRSKAQQEDLLDEISRLNSVFAASHGQVGAGGSSERNEAIFKFETAAAKYDEMQQNLHEGLKFYADLSRLLGELRDAVKNFVATREAEAQELAGTLASHPAPTGQSSTSSTPLRVRERPPSARLAAADSQTPQHTQEQAPSPLPAPAEADAGLSARGTPSRRPIRNQPRGAVEASAVKSSPDPSTAAPPAWDPSQGIRFG
ncbi:hypothetical protein JCM10908_006995 [Rhodotorula pacifica]|uniref:uncharacterized protein n=1 Tax=Rhodotorula pacifica TaxID=1495444 RepID=UPI003176B919